MQEDKVIKTTFFISLAGHLLLFLGMPGFDLAPPPLPEPKDISIVLEIEIPPLLPRIEVLAEEKKLKEIVKEEELPEPEPEPEPIPEPELETIPEPEPRPKPPVEPLPEKPRLEAVEVINPQDEAMLRYQDMIKQRIESHRRYPRWAKQQGFEGSVYLSFTVLANGQAQNIRIIRPSGFTILDNEAVSNVKRASPFPPIPEKLNRSQLEIEVAIVFILN
jgi:protein TonB